MQLEPATLHESTTENTFQGSSVPMFLYFFSFVKQIKTFVKTALKVPETKEILPFCISLDKF